VKKRSLADVAVAIGARLVGEDGSASSVSIDSRLVDPGTLFFALRGDHADGHEFVVDALTRGAAGAVVQREIAAATPLLLVDDVASALLDLAGFERQEMTASVVGITGSTGKTCTKDLSAAVLGSRFDVTASAASFNNEIGLPLTLLSATDRTEVVVCEMGSRGVGHIAQLCKVARPSIGIVTNVGLAHLELFGSRQNIERAKGELVEGLPSDGVAVLNADDPVVGGYRTRTKAGVITFGVTADADVRADSISLDEQGRPRFTLSVESEREHVELSVAGEHMVSNALAAAACGSAMGISAAECAAALKGARVSQWRMETFTTSDGVVIVNDSYNANPASMEAALTFLRRVARPPRACIAVLGHMAELGPVSREEHERVGKLAARLNLDRLITVGEEAVAIAHAAVREGLRPAEVTICETPAEAAEEILRTTSEGDVVLIKGSRVAGLDKVALALGAEAP
jgi:UDP-N-acetylmuramoyl-tripeptide--D-alanyl-D-alanine ligase